MSDVIRIIDVTDGPELSIVEGGGGARAVIWPGMGAQLRSIQTIELHPGAHTIELTHPGEAVYAVTAGSGSAREPGSDPAAGVAEQALREGSMVHVGPGTPYAFYAGPEGMSLVGGPSPPDPALSERIG